MVLGKYGKATESISDLLNKNYVLNKRKLKVTTTSSDGVGFTYAGSYGSGAKAATGSFEADYKKGIENVSIDKIALSSAGVFNFEAKLKQIADGLDVSIKAEDNLSGKRKAKVGLLFANDNVNIDTVINVLGGTSATVGALTSFEGFLVGGSVATDDSFGVKNFDGLVGYTAKDLTAVVQANNKFTAFSLSLMNKVDRDTTLAAQADMAADGAMSLTVGGAYKMSNATTLEFKGNQKGEVAANISQKVNSALKLTMASQIDTLNLGADVHKFGLSLAFSL
jgi:hypothetical protein